MRVGLRLIQTLKKPNKASYTRRQFSDVHHAEASFVNDDIYIHDRQSREGRLPNLEQWPINFPKTSRWRKFWARLRKDI